MTIKGWHSVICFEEVVHQFHEFLFAQLVISVVIAHGEQLISLFLVDGLELADLIEHRLNDHLHFFPVEEATVVGIVVIEQTMRHIVHVSL